MRQAIDAALESGAEYFANVWHDAGDDGRAILQSLVAGQPLPDSPRARNWLREQEVLGDDNRFLVPMVESWVRRRVQNELEISHQ